MALNRQVVFIYRFSTMQYILLSGWKIWAVLSGIIRWSFGNENYIWCLCSDKQVVFIQSGTISAALFNAVYCITNILFSLVDFQEVEVNNVRFWCYTAGHVLGAAMFMIEIAGVKVSMQCSLSQPFSLRSPWLEYHLICSTRVYYSTLIARPPVI